MLSFVKNRPPLVVIFLCILTAAFTLTYFAFYISSSDLILDNDVIYNWNQLLKHFNNHESCIEKETNNNKKTGTSNMKTVNTVIKISPSDYDGFNFIQGNFILEGWHPVCDKKGPAINTFEIAFIVPKTNLSHTEVCATITGQTELLPNFIQPSCNASFVMANKVTGKLTSKQPKEFCPKGTLTKILFIPTDRDNFGNYLSSEMKDTIYVHLLWSVYILFGVLVSIFIFAFLESNQHMRYIEKCSQLIQRK